MTQSKPLLFAGSSHLEFGAQVAKELRTDLGKISRLTFPDGEIGVELLEDVRGREAFVLQTIARRPNHYLLEMLIMIDALKRSFASSITAVIPYFGYARQDRKDEGKRVPITAKLIASLLEGAGADKILVMDLHAEQVQGFFDLPVEELYARNTLLEAVRGAGVSDFVVVAPDLGSIKLARAFAEEAGADFATIDKRRVSAELVETGALIGSVADRDVILVDDMISTGTTLVTAARVCKEAGAGKVFAVATHGIFAAGALEGSAIEKIFVTDTIPMPMGIDAECVSVAPLFARHLSSS